MRLLLRDRQHASRAANHVPRRCALLNASGVRLLKRLSYIYDRSVSARIRFESIWRTRADVPATDLLVGRAWKLQSCNRRSLLRICETVGEPEDATMADRLLLAEYVIILRSTAATDDRQFMENWTDCLPRLFGHFAMTSQNAVVNSNRGMNSGFYASNKHNYQSARHEWVGE